MSFRVTDVNFDTSRRADILGFADSQREKIQGCYRNFQLHLIEVGEVQSVIIARYDSEQSAIAATETVQEILGGMDEFMTAPPNRKGGPVTWEM